MITVLYAGLLAILLVILSINVIRIRRSDRISLGDGDNKLLARRIGGREISSNARLFS